MAGRPTVALLFLGADGGSDLNDHLSRRGYDVRCVDEVWSAHSLLSTGQIDVAVIGSSAPAGAGEDFLRTFAVPEGPLFLLMQRGASLVDRVLLLEMGSADVVDNAVTLRELAARVAGLVLRRGKGKRDLLMLETTTVDLRSAIAMRESGEEEQLSAGQIALLRLFMANPGRVLTRDEIVAAAPAESADAFDRSIDSRIVRLRRKLNTSAIATVRGTGYRFDPPSRAVAQGES